MKHHHFEIPLTGDGVRFLLFEYGPLRSGANLVRGLIRPNTRDHRIIVKAGRRQTVVIDPLVGTVTKTKRDSEHKIHSLARHLEKLEALQPLGGLVPRVLETEFGAETASYTMELLPPMPGVRADVHRAIKRLFENEMAGAYRKMATIADSEFGPVLRAPVHGDLKALHFRRRDDGSLCLIDWTTGFAPFFREILIIARREKRYHRLLEQAFNGEIDRLPDHFCYNLWPTFSRLASSLLDADEPAWLRANVHAAMPNGPRWRES